jgi:hypothetical protein
MRRHAKVLTITIAAVAVLGLGWWGTSVLGIGDKVLPETMAQRIQASLDELERDLTTGRVLHIKMIEFKRHGPVASEMEANAWVPPETTMGDVWLGPVDSDGIFTDCKGILTDLSGNTVQEVSSVGDEVVYRDVRFGEERRVPYMRMSAAAYLQAMADIAQRLLESGWSWVGNGTLDGKETVVIEKLSPWLGVSPEQFGPGDFVNPYTLDLDPRQVLHRVELVLDNPLLHSEQTWAIDQQGNRTLINEERFIAVEVVD